MISTEIRSDVRNTIEHFARIPHAEFILDTFLLYAKPQSLRVITRDERGLRAFKSSNSPVVLHLFFKSSKDSLIDQGLELAAFIGPSGNNLTLRDWCRAESDPFLKIRGGGGWELKGDEGTEHKRFMPSMETNVYSVHSRERRFVDDLVNDCVVFYMDQYISSQDTPWKIV